MTIGMIILLAILAALVLLILFVITVYNSLVGLRNQVENGWSQIDVQLKRRHDLIPNLVETVKGYAAHEKETLEKVISARGVGMQAQTVEDSAKATNMLTGTLKSLFAVAEQYPNLKADQHFTKMMEELQGIESNIAFSRQFYNDTVLSYNTKIQTFPGNVMAGWFKFMARQYFEIEEPEARGPVKVQF